jgi:hypothetical protein
MAKPCGPVQPVDAGMVMVCSMWNGAFLEILRTTPGPAWVPVVVVTVVAGIAK